MTGSDEIPVCPVCQKNDRVFKVSQIYQESLSIFNKKEKHPTLTALLENPKDNLGLPSPNSHEFTHLFTPPAGKTDFIRPIHPDIIMGVVFAIVFFLVYMVYAQMPQVIYYAVPVVVVAIVIYSILRKNAVQSYQESIAEVSGPVFSQEHVVEIWMKLYYCARDGLVIEPESGKIMRLDQMKPYLLRGKF